MAINLKIPRKIYGTNALIQTLAVLAVSLFLYLIADRFAWRWDATANREFSLSDMTVETLARLEVPVKILAFFQKGGDPNDLFIERKVDDTLREYGERSRQIDYQLINPDADLEKAIQYGISQDGTIIFLSGKNRKEVYKSQLFDYSRRSGSALPEFIGEGLFTNALLKVSREKSPVVCYLEGHGERGLNDPSPAGFSQARDFLQKGNFEVTALSLKDKKDLDLCHLLLIAGGRQMIPEAEDRAIQDYTLKGKPLLVMGDPMVSSGPRRTLESMGVTWENDLVIDPKRHFLLGAHYPSPLLGNHEITERLKDLSPIFSLARSLGISEEKKEGIVPLLTTSPEAWGETTLTEGSEPRFDKEKDRKGPLTLGVAITDQSGGRIIVVGDADFPSNGLIQAPGNLDLFLNMVGWLVGEKDQVTIRPKTPEFRSVSITPERAKVIFYFTQVGYPFMILGAGGIYWWKRRRL